MSFQTNIPIIIIRSPSISRNTELLSDNRFWKSLNCSSVIEASIRVIIVSGKLRKVQAEIFAERFKDLFQPYFVFSGSYYDNGQGLKYPQYYVVRLAEKNELGIEGHELTTTIDKIFQVWQKQLMWWRQKHLSIV